MPFTMQVPNLLFLFFYKNRFIKYFSNISHICTQYHIVQNPYGQAFQVFIFQNFNLFWCEIKGLRYCKSKDLSD